jgi:4-amino-4-deoxy-L-arabinose transferase-like glycosyltransferase
MSTSTSAHKAIVYPLARLSPTAGADQAPKGTGQMRPLLGGVALLTLAAALLLVRLDYPLLEPDETRYAELPRLMMQSGDYLTPRLEGKPYNDKPPLVYWLTAAGYHLFGQAGWVGRAVCALAGWLTVLAVYLWTLRHVGARAALLAGLVLQTSLGFLVLSRMLLLDSVLSFLVVSALLTGHHALSGSRLRWGWWLTSAALCGLGFLAKGPVAVVLVFPCLVAYRWLDRGSARFGLGPAAAYALLVAVLAVPWYAAMVLTNETFVGEHIWRHHVLRFLEPYHHGRPFWFYGPCWFVEMLPWSGVALAALAGWRGWSGPVRLAAAAATFAFVFFSLAKAKLPTYLLPMLPLNAIVVGAALAQLAGNGAGTWRARWLLMGGVLVVMLVIIARGQVVLPLLAQSGSALDYLALAALPALALGLWRAIGWPRALAGLTAAAALVGALVIWHVLPHHAQQAPGCALGLPLARWGEAADLPVVAYRGAWHGLSFARGGAEQVVFHDEDGAKLSAHLASQPAVLVLIRNESGRLDGLARLIPKECRVEKLVMDRPICALLVRRR